MENRFSGAIWAKQIKNVNVLLAGAGGTSSWLALFLGRSGINTLSVVDFDTFNYVNCGSQFVKHSDIGSYKVNALTSNLSEFTSIKYINNYNSKIEDVNITYNYYDVIIAGIDSMATRKYMFEKFLALAKDNTLFIDTRIGAEYWEVYAFRKTDLESIEKYKLTLFDDSQGNIGACDYQQSTLSAAGAAIQAAELVNIHITNLIIDEQDLPYKTTKDLRLQVWK